MRIALIGAGAIGGSIAACIAKQGYDLTVVAKYEEYASLIENQGIEITGVKGNFVQKIKAVAKVSQLTGKFDIVFVATKAYDVKENLLSLFPYLKENTSVVSLQNGICTDLYQEVVGQDRTVGCVVGYGATMHQKGKIEITSTGNFVIGSIAKTFKGDLKEVQTCLNTTFETIISDDIYSNLYSKLIINSCITSLGALTGLNLGEMMKIKKIRVIFLKIIDEAIAVANANHIQVPPYGGKLDYYKLYQRKSKFGNFINHLIIQIVGKKYRQLKSSSLQSLQRGQKTEIDYFNGYIVSLGKQVQVPTPINEKLVQMIKEIELHQRKITLDNINDIQ